MHEGDLETEHPAARLGVDQLRTCVGQAGKRRTKIGDLVGHVVHPGPACGDEAPDRSVVTEGGEQLDPAVPDAQRRRLHALLVDARALLEPSSEEVLVGRDRVIEVLDRDADVMDPARLHCRRSYVKDSK